jgi:hypothetical protein
VDESPQANDLHRNIDDLRHSLALVGRDITDLTSRDRRTTKSRLSLLHIHAVTGVLVGGGVIANGPGGIAPPAYAGVRLIPGSPLTVGAVLVLLGIVLGVATYRRNIKVEIMAVAGMIGWYLLFATSFAYAALVWQLDPGGQKPSWQGMFAYYGWAALLISHLRILGWVNRLNQYRAGVRT